MKMRITAVLRLTLTPITYFLFALIYVASVSAEPLDRERWLSICSDISSVGGAVMTARQKGVAKEVAIKSADGSRVIADLIEMAYQVQISVVIEEQQAIASEFEQDLHEKCLKGAPFK